MKVAQSDVVESEKPLLKLQNAYSQHTYNGSRREAPRRPSIATAGKVIWASVPYCVQIAVVVSHYYYHYAGVIIISS